VRSKQHYVTVMQRYGIPEHMHEGVCGYLVDRRGVGDFLRCLFEGKWPEAAMRADQDNEKAFYAWAVFMYSEVPERAHGTPEKYKEWIAAANEGP